MTHHHRIRTTEEVQLRAKALRQEQTPAEDLLWDMLRNRQLQGLSSAARLLWGHLLPIFTVRPAAW